MLVRRRIRIEVEQSTMRVSVAPGTTAEATVPQQPPSTLAETLQLKGRDSNSGVLPALPDTPKD